MAHSIAKNAVVRAGSALVADIAATLDGDAMSRKGRQEKVTGWKRASGTMHTRKCMVPLGNLHGWTSQLAWFSFCRCMDGLKKPDFSIKNHARYLS